MVNSRKSSQQVGIVKDLADFSVSRTSSVGYGRRATVGYGGELFIRNDELVIPAPNGFKTSTTSFSATPSSETSYVNVASAASRTETNISSHHNSAKPNINGNIHSVQSGSCGISAHHQMSLPYTNSIMSSQPQHFALLTNPAASQHNAMVQSGRPITTSVFPNGTTKESSMLNNGTTSFMANGTMLINSSPIANGARATSVTLLNSMPIPPVVERMKSSSSSSGIRTNGMMQIQRVSEDAQSKRYVDTADVARDKKEAQVSTSSALQDRLEQNKR